MPSAVVVRGDKRMAARRPDLLASAPTPPVTSGGDDSSTEAFPPVAAVRRWLRLLGEPDRIVDTDLVELLRLTGRLPVGGSRLEVGQAGVALLSEAVERWNPAITANWRH